MKIDSQLLINLELNIIYKLNWSFLFLTIGIFFAGLGAKWELIESSGIDLATKDAWGGYAKQTILPWLTGNLDYWENFWQPWTNHHIGFSRLWAIGMTFISGHWENQFSCTFSSIIPCITACFLLFIFRNLLNGIGVFLIPSVLIAGLCFHNGHENTLKELPGQFLPWHRGCQKIKKGGWNAILNWVNTFSLLYSMEIS